MEFEESPDLLFSQPHQNNSLTSESLKGIGFFRTNKTQTPLIFSITYSRLPWLASF